ncbi:MAG: hypothetical protein NZM04_10405 [Methylacidiphilales bacterium]|nr:hypothetical protein [Candidatus Methylacidiphilales bacterium]
MPREARTYFQSLTFHLINRGINRSALFHAKDDYAFFVQLLAEWNVPFFQTIRIMQDDKVQSIIENRAQKVAAAALSLNQPRNLFIDATCNRIYISTSGRFLQPDSIVFDAGDMNGYRYVGNMPLNYKDSHGLRKTYQNQDRAGKAGSKFF